MCSKRFSSWLSIACLLGAGVSAAEEPAAAQNPDTSVLLPWPEERAASSRDQNSPLVVRVLLKECADLREDEVERILSAELALDASHSERMKEPTWVVVTCAGNKAVVEVNDPLTRKVVQRRFDFGSAHARARGRLVALAAAELVLASWAEFAVLPAPRVEPDGPAPDPEAKRLVLERVKAPPRKTLMIGTDPVAAREGRGARGERIIYGDYSSERLPGRTGTRVLALSSVRKFPTQTGFLAGGGVRVGSDLLPLHGWALDALVESGTIGSLRVDNWTLGGMLFFVRELGPRVVLRGGAGLRAGLVRAWGTGPKARVNLPVFWGWPMLSLSAGTRYKQVSFELSTEAGYATLPEGPGSSDSSRGIWLSAQLGVGLSL